METEDELTRRLGVPATAVPDETMTLGAGRWVGEPATVPAQPAPPPLPSLEGDLVQLGIIAEGGMGRVYHARQVALARDVAVKTTKLDAPPEHVEALLREARVSGALEHPSIVPVYAVGCSLDGRPLLVMRKIEGVTWHTLLADATHPAWETHASARGDHLDANIDILIAISRALDFAHLRGIVHRDIKPSNVMLGQFGEVYLVDWGLATETGKKTSDIVGSPGYFAPEMVLGEPVDATTDVYLLGATLHRVLTGAPRHHGSSLTQSVATAARSPAATYAATVPRPLGELCNAACARARATRPASAAVFREALLSFKRSKSALTICHVATERLVALEEMLEAAEMGPPADLALAYRLATEARFGFAQALAEHPSHAPAKEGAVRAARALVDLELRQGHVDTASALVAEVPELASSLAPRIEGERTARRAREEETASLRELRRELDPTVGSRPLVYLAVALIVLSIGVTIYVGLGPRPAVTRQDLTVQLLMFAAFPIVIIAVASAIGRRRLFANTFNVRVVALVALLCAGSLVHRVVALRHGAELPQILEQDLLLFSLGSATGALTLTPRGMAVVPAMLAGAMFIELRPESALWVYPLVQLTTFITLGVVVWRRRRAR